MFQSTHSLYSTGRDGLCGRKIRLRCHIISITLPVGPYLDEPSSVWNNTLNLEKDCCNWATASCRRLDRFRYASSNSSLATWEPTPPAKPPMRAGTRTGAAAPPVIVVKTIPPTKTPIPASFPVSQLRSRGEITSSCLSRSRRSIIWRQSLAGVSCTRRQARERAKSAAFHQML
jgi:hypothetical protein